MEFLLLILLLPFSTIFVIAFAAFPFIFLPFMLIAQIGARLFLKNVRSALTGTTAVLAAQNKPYNIGTFGVFDGLLNSTETKARIQNILKQQDSNGQEAFARMKQFPVSFFGYSFFVEDSNFDLDNHVKFAPEVIVTEDCLEKYIARANTDTYLDRVWPKDKSPWEFEVTHLLLNSGKNKTLIFFTFDHMLFDGYSSTYLFQQLSDNQTPLLPEFTTSSFTKFQKFQFYFLRNIFVPWDFAKGVLIFVRGYTQNGKYCEGKKRSDGFEFSLADFSINDIRALKKKFGVKYDTILYSAVGATISRMMKEIKKPSPNYLTMVAPIPKPDHPKSLTNHFYGGLFSLPVSCNSLEERLMETDECFIQGRMSSMAQFIDNVNAYGGYLIPRPILNLMFQNLSMWTPLGASSFPPLKEASICGCKTLELLAGLGVPTQYTELIMLFGGQKTQGNAFFRIRHDLLPASVSVKFAQYFKEEIRNLQEYRVKSN